MRGILLALHCALLGLLSAGGLTGCAPRNEVHSRGLALTDCRLPRLDGHARCGTLTVPEDYAAPTGRKIQLHIAVLPAATRFPEKDPVYLFAGGPGQAASRLGHTLLAFAALQRERDVVLIDQRGTGDSSPLACPALDQPEGKVRLDAPDGNALLDACRAQLKADVRYYTTAEFIQDVDAVRGAFGHPRINIWGGSYGTRAALAYADKYPDKVRSMVLDGVAPPELRLPVDASETSEAALDQALNDCQRDPDCHKAFPSLANDLREVEQHLRAHPLRTQLAHPATGEATPMTLTAAQFTGALRWSTYVPESAALLPYVIHAAHTGDYSPLAALVASTDPGFASVMNQALHFSVMCAEDARRSDLAARARAIALPHMGASARDSFDTCTRWGAGTDHTARATPHTQIPMLLLSGGLDPVTPPRWGDWVASRNPRARHIVAPGMGHGLIAFPCVSRMVDRFFHDGNANHLASKCVADLAATQRPPFFIDNRGPR